jgi:hypothetical protein
MCYQEKPTLKDFQKIRTDGVNWRSSINRYSENVDWLRPFRLSFYDFFIVTSTADYYVLRHSFYQLNHTEGPIGVNWRSSINRYSENVDWLVNGDFLKTNIVKVKC